jgi:DNA-binding transcriptional MerR regulator
MQDEAMKLDALAAKAGTTPRTVRYYVQRGLLPAPEFRGRDTAYRREHLVRLRAIRKLQERYLPLDVIQATLSGRTLAEIERLAEGKDLPHGASSHASVAGATHDHRVPAPRPVQARSWLRFVLAPGLELHLEQGADSSTRALADALLDLAEKSGKTG